MSSTTGRNRVAFDYYPTPDWCADAALKIFGANWTLDPSAGDGALIRAVIRADVNTTIRGIEIQPELAALCPGCGVGDGLSHSWKYERVIANPPFANAIDWMKKACVEADAALFLVRLAMLSSKTRKAFWQKYPPKLIAVLSQRPSFTGGKTDSADYMWVGWKRGNVEPTRMVWL